MSGYGDRMDYDGYMLSLQFPHLDNTNKTPRVDSDVFDEEGNQVSIGTGYEYGEFTDQEWANEIVKHTIGGWEAEIIEEDQKESKLLCSIRYSNSRRPYQCSRRSITICRRYLQLR